MKILSLPELMRLSRVELCDELGKLINAFPDIPDGSIESYVAQHNLCMLRRAIAQRAPEPP